MEHVVFSVRFSTISLCELNFFSFGAMCEQPKFIKKFFTVEVVDGTFLRFSNQISQKKNPSKYCVQNIGLFKEKKSISGAKKKLN